MPLTLHARLTNYFKQTSRIHLTPKQRRRLIHKSNHNCVTATAARAERSVINAKRRAQARKQAAPAA